MTTNHNHRRSDAWRRRGGLLAALVALTTVAAAPVAGAFVSASGPNTTGHDNPGHDNHGHDNHGHHNSGVVRDWNRHATEALINAPTAPIPGAGQAPQVSALHLAMMHGAVYDAVNSIDGRHQPYLAGLPAASPGASQDAAAATAAHDVLVGLGIGIVPPLPQVVRDRLDALYADALAGIADDAAKADGIAAGAAAAAAMLAARSNDGRYVPFSFTPGAEPGQWRPAPPAFASDPFAWAAYVRPFVLRSPSQFQSQGAARHRESRLRQGVQRGERARRTGYPDSARNAEQNAIARFYTVHPVELFNRTFRDIAAERRLSLAEEARLFAMLNMAAADGLINCWSDKAVFSFWRPITAIHEGDNDGNRRTTGDAGWTSFLPTPPYPDHPSGYNCVSSAMMHTAEDFFGRDRMTFSVVRIVPNEPNVTRVYKRFSDVVEDTIDARVFQGIHFRTAELQGAKIGRQVANWLDKHYFARVK